MIAFILNQKKVITDTKSGENLLQFIRAQAHLKGTKVGCREGDCGACTVLVGSLQANGSVAYQSVTSCLASLASVAGKHVVTVEGLNLDKQLNKAQQSLHDHFATQCGFCTPGFVVSLTGFTLQHKPQHHAVDAISGNICRCTGYKSIERAAQQLEAEMGADTHDLAWLVTQGYIPEYFQSIPERLHALPPSLTTPESKLVSGGTDLYVREADALADLDITYFEGNKEMLFQNNQVVLGGGVTVSQLWNSAEMNALFPNLKQYLKWVSSLPIRNRATLAGNLVNASPIGDMSVFLLALDAQLTIKSVDTTRIVALKDFFLDYKKMDLQADETIESISFEVPEPAFSFNFEKVSKRTHLDIVSVNSAASIVVKDDLIHQIHLAIGGVAAIPKYLHATIAFLQNKPLQADILKEAETILQSEIAPIDDIRGSASYKRLLAKQLFWAHFINLFPDRFSMADLMR